MEKYCYKILEYVVSDGKIKKLKNCHLKVICSSGVLLFNQIFRCKFILCTNKIQVIKMNITRALKAMIHFPQGKCDRSEENLFNMKDGKDNAFDSAEYLLELF